MSVVFTGSYRATRDSSPASGSVTVTADGVPYSANLDANGFYSLTVPFTFAPYAVTETITGEVSPKTMTTTAAFGAMVDTSRGVNIAVGNNPAPLTIGAGRAFACTGVPTSTSCPGAVNGDVAIRSDGSKAAANTVYRLEAGAWVALV